MKKITITVLILVLFSCVSSAQCISSQVKVKVKITTDIFASEISWKVKDIMGAVIMQGGQGAVYVNNTTYTDSLCLPQSGCYFFEIFDTYGDGILSPGGYQVDVNGNPVLSGGANYTTFASGTISCPDSCIMTVNGLNNFKSHINGTVTLSNNDFNLIGKTFAKFPKCLAQNEPTILLCKSTVADYDNIVGALFTTTNTLGGFSKDTLAAPGLEKERTMISLQQAILDAVMTQEVFALYPQHIYGWKFNSCTNFPGFVNPPIDSTLSKSILIRANFEDPKGINPFYEINSEGMKHALRPTGLYLAPGSVVSITVPDSLVGQDYYIRVGSHDWDFKERPSYKRLDRISKKFLIDSTTMKVFNPLGGAISILVPYGANDGNVTVSLKNGVEAPFFSIKSFYQTTNINAELSKPGPWAVFESENVMYTIPKHSITTGQNNLLQTLENWEKACRGMNSILARQIIPDKHNMYMIADLDIRTGVYSIGYPMCNTPLDYTNVPGPAYFINGPGPDDEINFHETGHALAISKFLGEEEALVNFPYIMAMNYGLGEALNDAVRYSFVPNTFTIDLTAMHRMVSNTFGTARDISNTTTDEVRYQHRGYGHYFEIVNLFGWCALRNFWQQEFIDLINGIDHGIHVQNQDRRIVRLSIAAKADLRPLLEVFGIIPQDSIYVQDTLTVNGVLPSLEVYNRLQTYVNLIPQDSSAFVNYALTVYPNLFVDGPIEDPNFGVGWHYQKSLTYNTNEAQQRSNILQAIITKYFPSGQPSNINSDLCCLLDTLNVTVVNGMVQISGGVSPYTISYDTIGNNINVTVMDFDNCEVTVPHSLTNVTSESIEELKVYPNPASTEIFVDLNNNQVESLQIFSIHGQALTKVDNVNHINISNLDQGVYLLQIQMANGTRVNKKILLIR